MSFSDVKNDLALDVKNDLALDVKNDLALHSDAAPNRMSVLCRLKDRSRLGLMSETFQGGQLVRVSSSIRRELVTAASGGL